MKWHGWGRGGWPGKGFWPHWPTPQSGELLEAGSGAFPLSIAKPGDKVLVKALLAGHGAYYRAMSLGITPGTMIEVVENILQYPWSPVIVRVRGVEVALGRGLASKIIVERPVESSGKNPGEPAQERNPS